MSAPDIRVRVLDVEDECMEADLDADARAEADEDEDEDDEDHWKQAGVTWRDFL